MINEIKTSLPIVKFLDYHLVNSNLSDVCEYLFDELNKNHHNFIVTPNPEILLEAEKNPLLKSILKTTLNLPDGTGLSLIHNFLENTKNASTKSFIITQFFLAYFRHLLPGNKNLKRITGTDLMYKICTSTQFNKYPIFLLGSQQKTCEDLIKKIKAINPETQIVGHHSDNSTSQKNLSAVQLKSPAILFVAFGAPKQEIWLHENLQHLPSVKLAIGVGGAFDFISGNTPRAPEIMQKLNLEWLYRVYKQPWRLKRIYNAVIKFPITVLKTQIKN